ncbi:hypothetical protein [Actinokineospora inagensis]|uniref:hypothetical protein n=1 Tax=Actinokineospora inagensis TaxID=103730 RepID=UPI0003FCED23|nr:hypothetical protein [Actinokineospora inagensis]
MSHTTVTHDLVTLAAALGHHLVTYALPNPFQVDLSVRNNKKFDHEITVTINTASLAETATQLLHWNNTLHKSLPTLTGDTEYKSPQITISGNIADKITLYVTATLAADIVEEYRDRTITDTAVITWLRDAARGSK